MLKFSIQSYNHQFKFRDIFPACVHEFLILLMKSFAEFRHYITFLKSVVATLLFTKLCVICDLLQICYFPSRQSSLSKAVTFFVSKKSLCRKFITKACKRGISQFGTRGVEINQLFFNASRSLAGIAHAASLYVLIRPA